MKWNPTFRGMPNSLDTSEAVHNNNKNQFLTLEAPWESQWPRNHGLHNPSITMTMVQNRTYSKGSCSQMKVPAEGAAGTPDDLRYLKVVPKEAKRVSATESIVSLMKEKKLRTWYKVDGIIKIVALDELDLRALKPAPNIGMRHKWKFTRSFCEQIV